MDPRLEFTFQLLIDATGLPRSDIMDNVFDGNMLDEINELFLPHMRNKLIWFFQDVEETPPPAPPETGKSAILRGLQVAKPTQATTVKRKLFLTNGWDIPLTGTCIYMFRLNTTKQLPEEGFQKDLYCGVINSLNVGLVTTVQRVMEHVFMRALAQPSLENEEEEVGASIVRDQLLPGLRSFCSALKVCEEVCKEKNLFNDEKILMDNVIMESEQLRKENDTSGPQDELEYWKKRDAQFSQIVTQLEANEVVMTIQCLTMVRSKLIKQWKEADMRITYCYNEARDNAKYVQAIEKSCHALYLYDPVRMKGSILRLLQTVRLIHSVSQYYNTSERTSSLMVKITNQMIRSCKDYITCHGKENIWSQDRNVIREKLVNCVRLNKAYHDSYLHVKEHNYIPDQPPLQFSENYVFGKFDTFCRRLGKIITMFDLMDDYNCLFECRMEGKFIIIKLEDVIKTFNEIKNCITSKSYDYLDQRNEEFDTDYEIFIQSTNTLKENIASTIEENYKGIWETLLGIKFLNRFEKISLKIPLTQMSEKYSRILKFCDKQLDKVMKIFKKQKHRPPIARNFPPLSGKICWSRSLKENLKELITAASEHPSLKSLPETTDLQKKFNYFTKIVNQYEEGIHKVWVAETCLKKKLLVLNERTGEIEINFDQRLRIMIREAECMAKMKLPVPSLTMGLFCKHDHFMEIQDSLRNLLNKFSTTVQTVKHEVRPLFLPQLVRLAAMLTPALTDLDWTDPGWKSFVTRELNRKSLMAEEAVEEILELVRKAADEFKSIQGNDDVEFMIEGGQFNA
ncbi:hypothetical protein O3M35_002767 [Rhynocoris fuscipes]|uniref:Dynein heavy chain tail domain-containing protein n=1 Tax=Rhynocoris fuscipes TaxID=488301 RepID=A0AAW1CT99_9HEMI